MLIQRLAPRGCYIRGFRANLCAALVVMAGAVPAAAGAQTQVTVNPAVEVNPATEIRASRPNIRLGWSISNNSPGAIQVTVIARGTFRESASRCETADGCTLNWRLGADPLVPDQRKEFSLPPYETRDLIYEGRADALGPYQSGALVVWGAAGAQPTTVPIPVRIRRALPELGTGAVVIGPIGTLTRCPCGEASAVPVTITNASLEPITLSGLPRGRLLRDDGSSTYNHLVGEETLSCPGSSEAESGPTIVPGRPLSCTLRIALGPGRYRATVSLPGASLGATTNAADFSVRYPWPYAWIILFIGGLGGAWLASYQGSARRRALQLADVLKLSAGARKMHEAASNKQPHTREILQEILDDLAAKSLLLRTNGTADFGGALDALKARLPAIHDFAGLERRYSALAASAKPKQAYAAARIAVSAPTLPTDFAEKLKTLQAAIEEVEPDPHEVRANLLGGEPGPGDVFPIDLKSRSAKALVEWVRRNDQYAAFATVLLVATIGVATLWKSSPTWGSIGDILIALMTGIGATITGTLTIRQLVSGYPLPTIPRPPS